LGLPFAVAGKLLGACPSKERVCADEEKEILLGKGCDDFAYVVEIYLGL
jgi:hypothetical protein